MAVASAGRFEAPVPRRARILRTRLLDRLRDRFVRPITVIVAPAGMGKTTLLAQAVDQERSSEAHVDVWLTCRAEDAAASSLAEGLCRMLGTKPPTSLEASIDASVEILVNAIWHRSPAEVSLVLDDVHQIPDDSSGAELLTRLVAALPRNGHLVLAGRRSLPVAVSRFEVLGDVVRLGEADLVFDDDERDAFAAQRGVAPERLAECGGWPALSELAATAAPDVEAAYLWEEVLRCLPAQRRRDLALLAHVGPFDARLARAVLDREVTVVEVTADLPLVAATSTGGWKIHGLWRTHLANAVDKDEIAQARRRAGLSLAASGDLAAAIPQLVAADAWEDLTTVVTDMLGAAHAPIAGDLAASWLGQLPEHLEQGPLALLLTAVAGIGSDPRKAISQLQAAAEGFNLLGNVEGELACVAQLGQLAWWAEDPSLMGRLILRLFEMEAAGYHKAVPLACVGRALIADLTADAQGVLDELSHIRPGSLRGTWQDLVEWVRAMALDHLGRPAEALVAAEVGCATASPLLAPLIKSTQLQALWYLGDIQPVLQGLPRLADQAAAAGMRDNTTLLAAGAAMAHAAVGGTDKAVRYLDLARRSVATPDAPLVDVYLTIADVAIALAQGDEAAASRLLHDYLDRYPAIDTGVAASAHRRSLPLWYVLVPSTREVWDAAELGPCHALARQLARALTAIRAGSFSKADLPAFDDVRTVRPLLPTAWTVELALAYATTSRPEGWALLEAMWPHARDAVRRHATRSTDPIGKAARIALSRLPAPPTDRSELRLLGPTIELGCEGRLVDAPEWRRERVRSALAYLALHRPASRERMALDLWPKHDADAQQRNLRITLTHLLRALEPQRAERDASFLVRTHGSGLVLYDCEWLDVDLWHFDDAWQRATTAGREGRPPAALDAMLEAVRLWRGYPAELALNDWALPIVEERRLRLVNLATRSGELLMAQGRYEEARRMAEVALDADLWCERAHHVVIATHEAAGHHRAVIAARRRYHEAMSELGSPR